MDAGSGQDLVIVALPGVQRFIAEARTTSDVANASAIYSRLAAVIVRALDGAGELVLPAVRPRDEEDSGGQIDAESGMPNRVVALCPAGTGARVARDAATAARAAWGKWVRQAVGALEQETPGFPVVQWVCVPARTDAGYAWQWEEAQRLLAARRRVRDFEAIAGGGWRERGICSLSLRWPSEAKAPDRTPKHDQDAQLSVVGWVKRTWHRRVDRDRAGFPSTASIASAAYRKEILQSLGDPDIAATRAGRGAAQGAECLKAPTGSRCLPPSCR